MFKQFFTQGHLSFGGHLERARHNGPNFSSPLKVRQSNLTFKRNFWNEFIDSDSIAEAGRRGHLIAARLVSVDTGVTQTGARKPRSVLRALREPCEAACVPTR
jgi:hypothetical protein